MALADVAVLAPRHRNLMPLLPYLSQHNLAVRYERRDNILDAPLVRQLEQMSRLVLALADGEMDQADSLWPEVISYDFWGVATEEIWRISWQTKDSGENWTNTLLFNDKTKEAALFFLRLKDLLSITTLEQQLDILVGVADTSTQFELPQISPFFEHYFGEKARQKGVGFIELLGQLSTLRRYLNERRRLEDQPLNLADFITFVDEYRAAGLNVLDTNAYREAEDAVNVMTAYAAKGREFAAVFIIDAQDEVWGSASRTRGQYLSLPQNLVFIRYRGASEDERLRLLYVALTRAKNRLHLTTYSHTLAGKATTKLKYLDIREDEKGKLLSQVLPKPHQQVKQDSLEALTVEAAQNYWWSRHRPPFNRPLKQLKNYQISATHLNQFLDVTSGGPEAFLLYSLLGFPTADSPGAKYGSAVHQTIRWIFYTNSRQGRPPRLEEVLSHFDERLAAQKMAPHDHQLFLERGHSAMSAWFAARGQSYSKSDRYEFNFRGEAVFVGDAHLSGKVDRLAIDQKERVIRVVDFKTGKPYQRWAANNIRLHKYRQQLMFYKLLVENSRGFRRYSVDKGIVEFIEPDEYGQIVQLELDYDEAQMEDFKKLIAKVFSMIKELKLPDTSKYPPSIGGIRQFEKDLLALAATSDSGAGSGDRREQKRV
jgi:DNA helicase-2/ATP-dependent DNA helicase PcrA